MYQIIIHDIKIIIQEATIQIQHGRTLLGRITSMPLPGVTKAVKLPYRQSAYDYSTGTVAPDQSTFGKTYTHVSLCGPQDSIDLNGHGSQHVLIQGEVGSL